MASTAIIFYDDRESRLDHRRILIDVRDVVRSRARQDAWRASIPLDPYEVQSTVARIPAARVTSTTENIASPLAEPRIAKNYPMLAWYAAEQIGTKMPLIFIPVRLRRYRRIREIDIGKRAFGKVDASEFWSGRIHFLKAAVDQIGIAKCESVTSVS